MESRKGKTKGRAKTTGNMEREQVLAVAKDLYLQMFASYAVEKDIGAVNVQSGH